jgi:REP element-mobilizing transposase RayT
MGWEASSAPGSGFSARMANRVLGHTGPFWQSDYWDTYIRNERHFDSTISYIENNPVKAGLVRQPAGDNPQTGLGGMPD